jgi:hypothetical protein
LEKCVEDLQPKEGDEPGIVSWFRIYSEMILD